jgi:hypothetical protein
MRHCVLAVMIGGVLLLGSRHARAYEEKAVENGGSISGTVRVTGELPILPPQPVYKHGDTCGGTVRDERLVAGKGGVLANAVVFLDGVDAGKPVRRDEPVVLDNLKCAFVPHVVDGTVGQILSMHNGDPFLHDAHAYLGQRTLFNVALLKGKTVDQPLNDPGLIHINCNVRHTWMHAYVFVGENPYHAVTTAAGAFSITDIPPGTYRMTTWHEMLGTIDQTVNVEAGKATHIDLDMPAVAAPAPGH